MDLEGNELADKAAVAVASHPEEYIGIYYRDRYPIIKNIEEAWREE